MLPTKWPKIELRLYGYQPWTWVTSFQHPDLNIQVHNSRTINDYNKRMGCKITKESTTCRKETRNTSHFRGKDQHIKTKSTTILLPTANNNRSINDLLWIIAISMRTNMLTQWLGRACEPEIYAAIINIAWHLANHRFPCRMVQV